MYVESSLFVLFGCDLVRVFWYFVYFGILVLDFIQGYLNGIRSIRHSRDCSSASGEIQKTINEFTE